ncbi:hypothetical protein CB1_001251019 [Camelus ferus]|nr:hypothetical protein CB1_001251019 [Camelus ferus]
MDYLGWKAESCAVVKPACRNLCAGKPVSSLTAKLPGAPQGKSNQMSQISNTDLVKGDFKTPNKNKLMPEDDGQLYSQPPVDTSMLRPDVKIAQNYISVPLDI